MPRCFAVACVGVPGPVLDESLMATPVLEQMQLLELHGVMKAYIFYKVILLNDLYRWDMACVWKHVVQINKGVARAHGAVNKLLRWCWHGTQAPEVCANRDSAGYYSVWPSEGGMADFCCHSDKDMVSLQMASKKQPSR